MKFKTCVCATIWIAQLSVSFFAAPLFAQAGNPLSQSANPLAQPGNQQPGGNPLANNPLSTGSGKNPLAAGNNAAATGAPANAPAGAPSELRLKTVEFHDVTMGNVVSHTMLIPSDWSANGRIEWSFGDVVYPQNYIDISAPDKSHIRFLPAQYFSYVKMNQPMGDLTETGTPPPADLGRWLVELIARNNTKVSNVTLIDEKPDTAGAEALAKIRQQFNMPKADVDEQLLVITIGYVDGGVPMREEIKVNYTKLPLYQNMNLSSQTWSMMITSVIGAPAERFEAARPLLYHYANTFTRSPKWWNQVQLALMQINADRAKANMETIRQRAAMYDQISKDQIDSFNKRMAAEDDVQRQRINRIYEVGDFQGPDGQTAKLPTAYNNAYTDGKGNFFMTNSSEPPPAEWQKMTEVP